MKAEACARVRPTRGRSVQARTASTARRHLHRRGVAIRWSRVWRRAGHRTRPRWIAIESRRSHPTGAGARPDYRTRLITSLSPKQSEQMSRRRSKPPDPASMRVFWLACWRTVRLSRSAMQSSHAGLGESRSMKARTSSRTDMDGRHSRSVPVRQGQGSNVRVLVRTATQTRHGALTGSQLGRLAAWRSGGRAVEHDTGDRRDRAFPGRPGAWRPLPPRTLKRGLGRSPSGVAWPPRWIRDCPTTAPPPPARSSTLTCWKTTSPASS